jgi:DNA-binding transcriptional MerR regulator
MSQYYTITEVSRLTGLASHTIRYYEKQFPFLLDVERSKGGHRQYRVHHLENLKKVLHLLKEKKLSIKEAKEILGEPGEKLRLAQESQSHNRNDQSEVKAALKLVLDRLDSLCHSNERRDLLLETMLQRAFPDENNELLAQIARCRKETKETMKMYQSLMVRWHSAN